MERVSSMESVGAMDFYEEDCSVTAYMAVRNSVTKSELGKEHLELESNQLEDHINGIHDCQQDPDNLEVNEVCMGKEEEEEEDEGNASKVDEGGTTVSGIADVWIGEGGETTGKTERVHEQAQPTSVDVKRAKQDGGNSSKSMTKIWSDVPSYEDRDGIAKIDGIQAQAQRTTGPDVPGGVVKISNLKRGKGSADLWNDEDGETAAKTGVHEQAQPTSDDVRLARKERGNSSKINEESITKMWSDIPSNEDRDRIAKIAGVPAQAQRTTGPVCNDVPQKQQDAHIINLTSSINTRNRKESVNDKQASEEEEKGGGNTTKMEEDFKTSTEYDNKDAVNTPEMDSATEDSKEEGQNGGNIPTVNDKKVGEEEKRGGENTPKMEEDFKRSTECEDSDDVNTPKMDGATENSKEERQDGVNISDVNDKQAGEEEEKGGGNTTKMEEDFKSSTEYDNKDAVNTPDIDRATEDSEEEGQNGGNIPTECEDSDAVNTPKMDGATEDSKEERQDRVNTSDVNDKQASEEEEKGGGNTTKMEEDFKTIIEYDNKDAVNTPKMDSATEDSEEERQDGGNIPADHDGGCDSEQDADNSPSWWNGTNIWQLFSVLGFCLILLISIQIPCIPSAFGTPYKYAADPGNTQKFFICDHFSTLFINTTGIFDIHSKSRCYCESKKKNCSSGFEGFCLPLVTEKQFIAGCINTTGLHLHREKCLLVTIVEDHNKYEAECHDKKCPTCTNANSLEERLKRCLFQNETSGDSNSTECSPENSGTTSGCVQPTCWILGLGIAVVLFVVLTSQ